MDLAPHKKALVSFAENHLTGNDADDSNIRIKINHSLHVLENASQIVVGENILGHTADLCRLAALYHDIGRFPQFAQYQTFNDKESVNHGRLGVLTLRDFAMPTPLPEKDMRILRFAVGQHNLKTIRPTLPTHVAIPTQVTRDADKIDIFRVMLEHFSSDNPDPRVTHGFVDIPGKYTREIYDTVMAEKPGDYALIQCANDFKLLLIGWLHDLHFATSIKILDQRKYINNIFSFLPEDENIRRLKEKTNHFIDYNLCKSP